MDYSEPVWIILNILETGIMKQRPVILFGHKIDDSNRNKINILRDS